MSKTKFVFDILFDSDLKDFCTDKELSPIERKFLVLRMILKVANGVLQNFISLSGIILQKLH